MTRTTRAALAGGAVALAMGVSVLLPAAGRGQDAPAGPGVVSVIGYATDASSFRLYTYDENRERTGAIFKRDLEFPAPVVGLREAVGLVLVTLPSRETVWLSVADLTLDGIDVSNVCIPTGTGGSRSTMGAGKRECG